MIRRLRTLWADLKAIGDPFDIPDWPDWPDNLDQPEEADRD